MFLADNAHIKPGELRTITVTDTQFGIEGPAFWDCAV
jgi:hypothetical protein